MHLEAVRLFSCPRPGVDAADIRFRIGIGSSSHGPVPNNYVKQRWNQRVAVVLSLENGFFRRWQIPCPPFFFVFVGGQKHVTGMPSRSEPSNHFH
jgi:hypothetical protein